MRFNVQLLRPISVACLAGFVVLTLLTSACGTDPDDESVDILSAPTIAPTPTFVVIVFTPTPVPPPTPTPTPRPDNLVPVEFPEDLGPYSLNPPQDEETAAQLWKEYLSDAVILRDDGPPIHMCDDGRMLSDDQNIRPGMTWRVGWTEDMTWKKWWEVALFIQNQRGREFMATLLDATDEEFIGAIPSESGFGLFESDAC